MQLLQGRFIVHRQAQARSQFVGKACASLQGRADQHVPRPSGDHGLAHLRPAFFGQGVVEAAAQAAAVLGFTMAQQVEDHAGRSATAASAKVAICPCKLALELADARLEHAVGLVELAGYLTEQGKRLLQARSTFLFDRGSPLRIGTREMWAAWGIVLSRVADRHKNGVVPAM